MLNPSFENVLKEGDNKYTLVMLVSKRARQLIDNPEPLVETESIKPVTIAIEEIISGKVKYKIKDKTEEEIAEELALEVRKLKYQTDESLVGIVKVDE